MSIIDSMYDQFYEHLMECPVCKDAGAGDVSPKCEKGMRMKKALDSLNDLD